MRLRKSSVIKQLSLNCFHEHITYNICLRYHLHVPSVKKIRGLNLPDPHGPVQACSGTALLLLYCESDGGTIKSDDDRL